MISSNYSLNLASPLFKGASKVPPEVREKLLENFRKETNEIIINSKRTMNRALAKESGLIDPFVALSEKMEIIDSGFSKMLAKVLRFFNM